MSHDATVERVYAAGRARLRDRGDLGGEHLDFLLPACIGAARGDQATPPPYGALSAEEQLAVGILLDVMVGPKHPTERYPRFLGPISTFECELRELREAPLARSWWTGQLTQSATKQLATCLETVVPIVRTLVRDGLPDLDAPVVDTHVDDFEWLEAHPDPDLWHVIVGSGSLNADTEAADRFVSWVIDQPECDRATAAFLYVRCHEATRTGPPRLDSPCDRLMRSVAHRSEQGDGYPRSELTLSQFGMDDDQRSVLDRIEAGPDRLLGTRFVGRRTRTPYVFHSETVIQTGIQRPPG